jgi:hypothetical protein
MSVLGKLLRSIRLKKNISELKASRRAALPLEKYVLCERSPEKIEIKTLVNIFNAIEMTDEEFQDFSLIAKRILKNSKNAHMELPEVKVFQDCPAGSSNILKFTEPSGIRKVRTDANTKPNEQSPSGSINGAGYEN